MIVYLDLVFIINLVFDYCLLLTVDLLLHRNTKYFKIFLGSLIGELSMFTLVIKFNNITLFLFKIVLSYLMSIITFKHKDIKYNLINTLYLYLVGIILGGFLTYIYNEFQVNLVLSLKYLIILILSPICLYIYYKFTILLKNNYQNYHKVLIDYGEYHFEGMGFLDSGNKLTSPYSHKPIILVEKEYLTLHKLKLLPVPYNALNHSGILNCFKPDKVVIDNNIINNVLIGISDIKFHIDNCNVLLNAKMEGI